MTDYDGRRAPVTLAQANDSTFRSTSPVWPPPLSEYSGIIYAGSQVKSRQITDGLSKTYALGERCVDPNQYETGAAHNDDWSMYTGFQNDITASTYFDRDLKIDRVPKQDTPGAESDEYFGSAHPSGCHMSMCDGSVTIVSYGIDPEVYRRSGHRADGGAEK
jgi:prepilin-type processing-associated H-X9-DG protein